MPLYLTMHPTPLTYQSGEVLAEDVILAWYSKYHAQKGKTVFLEQMTKFTEWLLNADEGMLMPQSPSSSSLTSHRCRVWRRGAIEVSVHHHTPINQHDHVVLCILSWVF